MAEFLQTLMIAIPLWSIAFKLDNILNQLKKK
jgi:hypothetical protein